MAYKLPVLPPVYTKIGSVVFGDSSVHGDISLTGRLLVTLVESDDNYAGVSLTRGDIDRLINFLRDMQAEMR